MADSGGTGAAALRSDAARNRARLLDAARQRLAGGDTTLGLNALARCAGVGVGTAYRHFPDRQSLVEGLATEGLKELLDAAQQAAGDLDPAVGLERLLRAALSAMAADSVLAEVLSTATPVCAETIGLSRELGVSLERLLDRARCAGLMRPDVGADDLRRLLVGAHSAAQAGSDPEAARERYLAVLLAGLRHPAAGALASRAALQVADTRS